MPRSPASALLAPALLSLALGACGRHAEAPRATRAWVRLPAVEGQPAAAYFTLEGGGHEARLIAVASAVAQKAEMHESMGGSGLGSMAGMAPLAEVAVPAGGSVAFAPGGRHVMLYGLDPAIKPGTAIPLRFGFKGGQTAEAEAKTVPAGEGAPY